MTLSKLKAWAKSLIPKLAGITVLALTAIQANGHLPRTPEDWVMLSLGVGLTFASNNTPKINDNGQITKPDL